MERRRKTKIIRRQDSRSITENLNSKPQIKFHEYYPLDRDIASESHFLVIQIKAIGQMFQSCQQMFQCNVSVKKISV